MKANTENLPEFWNAYETSFTDGLPEKIEDAYFVVLDTETTGFSIKTDRILSIGALRINNSVIKTSDAFEVFLHQEKFEKKTVEIHGILKNGKAEQVSEVEGLKKLLLLLENAIIVAHHVAFDVGMLNHALQRNGLPKLINKTLDTSILYRKIIPKSKRKREGNYSLDELAEDFEIEKTDRHTALGDAYITSIAFLRILGKLKPASLDKLLKKDRFWEFWK